MTTAKSVEVVIFAESDAQAVTLFVTRMLREAPGAALRGVVYRRPNSARNPTGFSSSEFSFMSRAANFLLCLFHGSPLKPTGRDPDDINEMTRCVERFGGAVQVVRDWEVPTAVEFVQRLKPALGIVLGAIDPFPELFRLPAEGSLRRQVQKMENGARSGHDLPPAAKSEGNKVIVSVYLEPPIPYVSRRLDDESFPIELYDTATSLYLKSDLVARDLLIRAVRDFGEVSALYEIPADNASAMAGTKSEKATEPFADDAQSTFRPKRGRPAWKLLIRTLLFAPYVIVRNGIRRIRSSFPIVILYHHVVTDRPSHVGVSTEWFLRQVHFLKKHYRIVSLTEAIRMLKTGKVTVPTVVLTFDDGYRDNFINLRAVTERTGLPAVLFVSTEHISSGREFEHDLVRNQRNFLPLTWDQIRFLRKSGLEIGGHTRTHFDCGSTDAKALEYEIVGSKKDLETELGEPAEFFSFPWGHPENISEVAVKLAKDTYSHVFSAFGGVNFPERNGEFRLLLRTSHPSDLWELELAIQSILDF